MNEQDLKTVSEDYSKFKNYKRGANKDYIPFEKTEHTRKITFVHDFNGNLFKFRYIFSIFADSLYDKIFTII